MDLPCLRLLFNRSKPLLTSFLQNLVTFAIVVIFVICVLASMKNPCYFCGICGHFEVPSGFFFSKVANLVDLLFLECKRCLASKKNPCYFCDICGYFEASLGFCFSKVKFVILALFATFVRGVLRTKHTLVTNCINFYLN